jgi:hypothetical protein
MSVRTTDQNVASHSRLVYENIIAGLRAAFDDGYTRDPQLTDLRIAQSYPNKKIDYPSIVVEYSPQRNVAAGVGHMEVFPDPRGFTRKWQHRRFEGTLTLTAYALSTLDRDLLCDAIAEVLGFGRLNSQLNRFFEVVYPSDRDLEDMTAPGEDYAWRLFSQLMLDTDSLTAVGNGAEIAPWQPEDLLVYSGGWALNIHGGYYNTIERVDWSRLNKVEIMAFTEGPDPQPPPFVAEFSLDYEDAGVARGQAVVRGGETS